MSWPSRCSGWASRSRTAPSESAGGARVCGVLDGGLLSSPARSCSGDPPPNLHSRVARFRSALVTGAGEFGAQKEALARPIDVLVGTPQRVVQHAGERGGGAALPPTHAPARLISCPAEGATHTPRPAPHCPTPHPRTHLTAKSNVYYGDVEIVVLDEADTMFDRGFGPGERAHLLACSGREPLAPAGGAGGGASAALERPLTRLAPRCCCCCCRRGA